MTYRLRNIGIAIALAVVAALLTTFYVTNYKRSVQHGESKVPVYVASHDIELGTSGSDVDTGTSPFEVLLSVDATGLTGTLMSIAWDLGDGDRATSLVVPHTYVNEGEDALRIPITATVTMQSSSGTTVSTVATRIITVEPGLPVVDPGDPTLPGTQPIGDGGAAVPCSGLGVIPLLFGLVSLMWMRRRP